MKSKANNSSTKSIQKCSRSQDFEMLKFKVKCEGKIEIYRAEHKSYVFKSRDRAKN